MGTWQVTRDTRKQKKLEPDFPMLLKEGAKSAEYSWKCSSNLRISC